MDLHSRVRDTVGMVFFRVRDASGASAGHEDQYMPSTLIDAMDGTMINMHNLMKRIPDGFPEQRMVSLSRELQHRQASLPVSRQVHVTGIGHFPRTDHHYISRKHGLPFTTLVFCASGKGRATLAGRTREITAGHLVILPPDSPHHYEADVHSPWNIYWFQFGGTQSAEILDLLNTHQKQGTLYLNDSDTFIKQFERLYASVVSAFSDAALIEASVEALRTLSLINRLQTGENLKSRQTGERILGSISHLTHHYAEPHTLEKLAGRAGLSVPHYMTLFKKQTGTSPMRYLTRIRLRHACRMLDQSPATISEIAYAVGYEDPLYFSRVFHTHLGRSPLAYRKLNRPDSPSSPLSSAPIP
jgi:AraC-like DNA-binding protein